MAQVALVDERDITDVDPLPVYRVWIGRKTSVNGYVYSVFEMRSPSLGDVEAWACMNREDGYAIAFLYDDGARRVCAWLRGNADADELI